MKSVWRALIWKEWHEHKWKIAALTAVLVVTQLCCLINVPSLADAFLSFYVVSLCFAFFAPIFIAAENGSSEAALKTMAYLQSQPVPLWKAGLVKLMLGYIALLTPLLFCFAAILASSSLSPEWKSGLDRSVSRYGSGRPIEDVFAVIVLLTTSIYVWAAAIGVNRHSLVSAAARILAVIVGIWFSFWVLSVWSDMSPDAFTINFFSILPGGLTVWATPLVNPLLAVWILSLTIHALLAALYIFRFGQPLNDIPSPQEAPSELNPLWLATPRKNQITSLIWKQFRESLPTVTTSLAVSLAISGTLILGEFASAGRAWQTYWERYLVDVMAMPAFWLGFITSIVIGVGLFHRDLMPGTNAFWRSRPINPHHFYWIKLITGLVVLYSAFALPFFLAIALGGSLQTSEIPETWPYLTILPFLGCSIAVLAVTCTRNAVFACIVSFGGALALTLSTAMKSEWKQDIATQAAILLSVSLFATLFAWLAVRYDWSLRR